MVESYMPLRRGVYLSAIDDLPGLDGDADLLAVALLEANAGRLAVGGHVRDLRNVHRRFRTLETALRVGLRGLLVAHGDIDARHDDLAVLGQRLDDFAGPSLVLA